MTKAGAADMTYKIIRSSRKTLALSIKGLEVIVRAPYGVGEEMIEEFVLSHRDWIERQLYAAKKREERFADVDELCHQELQKLKRDALKVFEQRCAHYGLVMGVDYQKISVRCQKTRWGSCNSKGQLSFNCLLLLAPPEVLDSVVVHELCHIKYMNHSKEFYDELLKVFPNYKRCRDWLKENGEGLIKRLPMNKKQSEL